MVLFLFKVISSKDAMFLAKGLHDNNKYAYMLGILFEHHHYCCYRLTVVSQISSSKYTPIQNRLLGEISELRMAIVWPKGTSDTLS